MSDCIAFGSHRTRSARWYVIFVFNDGSSTVHMVSGPDWIAEAELRPGQPIRTPWLSKRAAARFERLRREALIKQQRRNE